MATDLWSSARLIYRGVDTEDEDFLADLSADADAFLNVAPLLPVPRSKKTATEFREYLHGPQFLVSAIVCLGPAQSKESSKDESQKPKPTPIGILTLRGDDARNQHHRRCEIGINLLRAHQGQGYGSEAIKWSLRWGFKRANLHRMEIGAMSWNEGAVRLYERLGFVHEGRRRDFFWHDGKYHDSVEMSMLEQEWREMYDGKKGRVEVR